MSLRSLIRLSCSAILLTALAAVSACHKSEHIALNVSAAASLQNAMAEIETSYRQSHPNVDFTNNFGSSGTLAIQIEQGAPADLFLSAAAGPMDELDAHGLLESNSRHNLLRNTLVLIAPPDFRLADFQGLLGGSVKRVALGDPASVPAGRYGKQTLVALHLFDKLRTKIVLAKDVRQVLTYVETGNADAGLVYSTDALASDKVRVVAEAPENSHDPIVYPVALVKQSGDDSRKQASGEFEEFLSTPAAQSIFQKHGFTIAAQ